MDPQGGMSPEAFERAYWQAFYCLFGDEGGRVLKAMLLTKTAGHPGPEWMRVQTGLREIFQWQATAVQDLAIRLAQGKPRD